jgi:hypothetical protein
MKRIMNNQRPLVLFSIGMRGSFPRGQPEYQGFAKIVLNSYYKAVSLDRVSTKSFGVWKSELRESRLAPRKSSSFAILGSLASTER